MTKKALSDRVKNALSDGVKKGKRGDSHKKIAE